ncbi:uncharacterized protein M421DRAFT_5977 [Didymella exigua CBS 183.55]|uniref:Uncharacterized protein n=1 Tax=Didymella exigua CBS 183.55 TaxID=1150837 RepID=A0A6A5RHC0_9PLEO|nr:uncharacterized protein M421DRAFT_5977 [Didymella exigua CBS 183.55]KAF1927715.1 hypothetical protein M421DRAFT_5977 [Didymella exigua CBS 183.55]
MSQQVPTRPAVAPLQFSSAQISSYSSSSSLASPSLQSAAPLSSPAMPSAQQQYSFASPNQPQQQQSHQQQSQPHPRQLQRHPSYEYQPNRQGAGSTQNETAAYLNSAALLAEAAKRASIQVVMRDIEEMEL